MTPQQTSTHDLRSGAKEFRRDKEHRVKWAHGPAFGPGRRVEENRPRPARIDPVPRIHRDVRGQQKARTALHNDMYTASGESSADEDIEEPSAAPVPDAEITYSYDAERGPSHGSQILGLALEKAIQRYEVVQTDKLIKEEYEVLDPEKEALTPGPRIVDKADSPEDADYGFVEV
ncbi:hypothetical protein M011DRAFT_148847 [Sporormia fimetaria CBS 119925]|uniref:Uncharacterized protein n=1 Tax=Sporormia fimetaria CBS 119925 TaxID=1340428 RepID=A0A6A6V717_9PLEO|nr:hypothetical protein M011DRAFT_148847 [Sporormia fimetaria CBS 119925]